MGPCRLGPKALFREREEVILRMMSKATTVFAPVAILLLCAAGAHANNASNEKLNTSLMELSGAFGAQLPAPPPVPVGAQDPGIDVEEGQVNFEYAEMVDRMEAMSRTVIGRKKKKHKIDTGVTAADRVDAGAIKYIVLHASGGATGKPKACEGSVTWLLSQKTAAHFMVCRDGRVIRMVKIENIANQVKNSAIDAAAVGIETESGHPGNLNPFVKSDWNPESYWRMYASMAWLIRAIAKETNVPRDRQHVITHEESDRGMARAHVDPGPYFQDAAYPEFDARFPGQAVTPREYLMRLVADDVAPQIWMVAAAGSGDQVEIKDTNSLGLSHIRVWQLDAAGKPETLIQEWSAPVSGMPPVSMKVDVPSAPGAYRIVARDLVGNTSAGLVKVPGIGPGDAPVAATRNASLLMELSAAAD